METIIVTIDDGNVEIETKGFRGGKCKTETAALKRALGDVTASKDTAEMHQTSTLTARNR